MPMCSHLASFIITWLKKLSNLAALQYLCDLFLKKLMEEEGNGNIITEQEFRNDHSAEGCVRGGQILSELQQ